MSTGATCAEIAPSEPLERILETARTFLTDSLTTDERVETRVEIGQLDNRLRLTRCAHPPTAQLAPGARAVGNGTVNVRCSEPVAWSIFVPVRVERYTEVVVVAKALSRQQIIQPGDVRLERLESTQLAHGYFDEIASVIGQQTKRALTPGEVLSDAHVVAPKLVARGQQVTLFSARPGLTVRMKGEALEDGAVGQRIRVRNRTSKRIVEGYVEPSGAIRVAF
jgi:flagella basal body P-ring formation protein FlgA